MPLGRTTAETAELELGKSLSDALPKLCTHAHVARTLGISRQAVIRLERRALAKVAAQLKAIYAQSNRD